MMQLSPISPVESTGAALRRLRTAAVAGVLLLAGAILLSPGCQRSPEGELPPRPERPANREASEHPAVGKRLSELKVIALDDASKSVTLADLSGKVVLVDLWGPWCPPCRWELPHIAALGQKYRSSPGFQLLAVSSGQTRPENIDRLRKETRAFLKDAGLDLPTYLDPGFVTRRAFAEAGDLTRLSFPTTFVMDRRGVIRGVWEGYSPSVPEQIDQTIAQLLEEKAN
jgi:thiol-disulfide isomerase/thioredoxin